MRTTTKVSVSENYYAFLQAEEQKRKQAQQEHTLNCMRSLRKIWFDLFSAADHSCDMNHLIDGGEFSGARDIDIYMGAYLKFKRSILRKHGIYFKDFHVLVNQWGQKSQQAFTLRTGGWDYIAQSIAYYEHELKQNKK